MVRHNTSTGAANPSQMKEGTIDRRPILSRELYTLAVNPTLFAWNNTVIDCGTSVEGERDIVR